MCKAKTTCEVSGNKTADHFADIGKMVDLGSQCQREVYDIMLTRYACYLIAQNGDSRKQEIVFAAPRYADLCSKARIAFNERYTGR